MAGFSGQVVPQPHVGVGDSCQLTDYSLYLYFTCMNIFDRASTTLQRCEHELRDLGALALKEGNYDAARRIAELAESLADSCVRVGMPESSTMTQQPPKPTSGATAAAKESSASEAGKKTTVRRKRAAAGSYPQFRRRGEKLVKVGWSKKNRQEYEHNAPWPVVHAFAVHLRTHIRSGRIFNIESLLPAPDPDGHGELPTYQIYLALAWLRSIGLVEKRSRDGYVANRKELIDETIAAHWAAIPANKN